MFKTYSSSSSLVITSRWFATSHLVAPVSVKLVCWQYAVTGSDNGSVSVWHWAIIWSDDDPILWCIYASPQSVDLLAPGRFERNLRKVIFKLILMIGGWGIFCKIALRWMPMDLTDDKSTLVQVMAWCHQATSHCLSQCWPRSMSPYSITRPQGVKCALTFPMPVLHIYGTPNWSPLCLQMS